MKKWLYFLIDDQGRSYRKNGNVVDKTAAPTPLPFTPDGWQDVSIGFERNTNKHGVFRTFTLPLGFVKAANDILRDVVIKGTVESRLFLLIKKFTIDKTLSTYRFIYRYFYKGELDLTTVELNDTKSTVNIMEGGISKMLAANEDTVYDIPLESDPEAIEVKVDGFVVKNTVTYKTIETASVQITNERKVVLPVFEQSFQGLNVPGIIRASTFEEQLSSPDFVADQSVFFFRIEKAGFFTYRIYGSLNFTVSLNPANVGFQIQSHSRGNDLATQAVYSEPQITYAVGNHTINFDTTITVPGVITEAESLYIVFIHDGNLSAVSFKETEIKVEYDYRFAPTIHKALKPATLFKRLCGKALGSESYAQSAFFDANQNLVITSGDELRQLPDSVIKTSLKDFFQAYNCWYNLGASIEDGKYRIEEKQRYYNASGTPFHLGKAKDLKLVPATEFFVNLIKAGYPEQEYDEVWGKNEFNNTFQFTTPITRKKAELNLISPYRADPTGIEIARINYDGKDSTDSKDDNTVFVLNVDLSSQNLDGSYNLNRPAFSTISGIPVESQSTIYNVHQLTPKRILLKHGSWIRSIFYGFEDQRLKFGVTEKNRQLRTILSGAVVDEDLDELIGNLEAPLFKPWLFKFTGTVPDGIVESFETNQNQHYTFEYDGVTYKGFAMAFNIAANDNKDMEVTLLSTIDNDLTQLL